METTTFPYQDSIAVIIPPGFHLTTDRVNIERVGTDLTISPISQANNSWPPGYIQALRQEPVDDFPSLTQIRSE